MGFLDNTTTTVDAILTKKGRELLARGQKEFNITKYALADDEVDYNLWDTSHPNGTNFYGAVIENMPLLEATPDENQIMRYKLVTLPKNTAKLPIMELPSSNLTFNGPGISQTITPNTRNGSDATLGYTFVLHNADAANLTVASGGGVTAPGVGSVVFLSEEERQNSITVIATSVNIVSRSTSSQITTQITIAGNETGASQTITATVNPAAGGLS